MAKQFKFLDTSGLFDGEIRLCEVARRAPEPDRGRLPFYYFDVVREADWVKVGEISLRIGNNENIFYGGHIGYMVLPDFRGNGYAVKAASLLLSLARRHFMRVVRITCNPDNTASRRVCEKLGAVYKETVALPPHNEMYLEGEREKCIYELWL